MTLLKNLNPQQAEAAQYTDGPLLILAGAGSGKTKTLTHRIAHLIDEHGVHPRNILAVTFTNKAATEMRERVSTLLGRDAHDRSFMPYLGTFHSVCVRILRQEADKIGLSRQFVIFDSQDSMAAIKQIMRELGIDDKRYKPAAIRGLISSAKNELVDYEEYKSLASGDLQQVAASVYPRYQRTLNDAQALDFDDLLLATVKMFSQQPDILKRWRGQFEYILIDEYQDTNHVQYQFVKLLAQEHKNVCVVGDDWQSVYSWRGANFRNILDFERDYPEAKVVKLEQNYRSTRPILDAAQSIISKNEARSDKELWTEKSEGEPVRIHQAANDLEESRFVVDLIRQFGYNHEDVAVLYRTNAQSRALEEAFIRFGIPYQIVGGTRFYERQEVKDMLAYIRLAYQPDDMLSFRRIVNVPTRGIGAKTLENFLDWQAANGYTLSQALHSVDLAPDISSRARKGLQELSALIQEAHHRLEAPGDVVQFLAKRSGYIDFLNDGTVQAPDRIENVEELISVASRYDDMSEFLEEVALVSDVDSMESGAKTVTLMTLHAAKGLEFPAVFMVGMEEGVFPHSRSLFDEEEMEEERRLCYVGMTRAMQSLHLLHAQSRMLYGKTMSNSPARFLSEIDSESMRNDFSQPAVAASRPELKTGDSVRHPVFGMGVVSDVNDAEVQIAFAGTGIKKLLLEHAPLEKIE